MSLGARLFDRCALLEAAEQLNIMWPACSRGDLGWAKRERKPDFGFGAIDRIGADNADDAITLAIDLNVSANDGAVRAVAEPTRIRKESRRDPGPAAPHRR